MAMNRIQFQSGLSLVGFLDQYGTEAACARALKRARWPKGFFCELRRTSGPALCSPAAHLLEGWLSR